MRETLILKAGTAPPEGCTPSTGAPAGYEAWTREVEDTEWHDAPKRAPGKPRTILDAVEMILSGLESEISEQTPAMPLPFSVDAPEVQTTAPILDTMTPLSRSLIRKIIAALRSAEVVDLGEPHDPEKPSTLHALAAEDRRRVLLHLKRLLGATITIYGQKQQPDALADGLAILALMATPGVREREKMLAARLNAEIVDLNNTRDTLDDHFTDEAHTWEEDSGARVDGEPRKRSGARKRRKEEGLIRRMQSGTLPLPHPPKHPEPRKIGTLHQADRVAYDLEWQTYTERMATYKIERNARLVEWATRLAKSLGRIEQIRHQQRTTSPITWALDLAIQIGVIDPATGAPIGTVRTVERDDAAILDALAAAVVPDASREADRETRTALRAMLEMERADLLALIGEVFTPYLTGNLVDRNLRDRVKSSLAALTATPEAPDAAERLRWYRARCARLGALLWPPPSPHEIQAEMAAAKARLERHAPKAAVLVAAPERSEEREGEPLEPERLGEEDAIALAIVREMGF